MAEDTIPAEAGPGWETVLDRLETDIHLAFAGEDSGWAPPADLGPIPPELIDRALQLLSARHETELMLAEKQSTVARHLNAVDSIPDSKARPRQLLDVQG